MLGILLVSHLAFASQVNCADLRKIANDSIESARLNFKSELNRVDERNIQRRKLAELIILTLNAYVRKTDTDEVYSKIKSTASSAFFDTSSIKKLCHHYFSGSYQTEKREVDSIVVDMIRKAYSEDSVRAMEKYSSKVNDDTLKIYARGLGCVAHQNAGKNIYQISGKGLLSKTQEGKGTGDLSIGFDYWNSPVDTSGFLEWGVKLIVSNLSVIESEFSSKLLNPDDNGVSLNGYWSSYAGQKDLGFGKLRPGIYLDYHVSPYQWRRADTSNNVVILSGDAALSLRMFDVPVTDIGSGMQRFSVTGNLGIGGRMIAGDVGQNRDLIERYLGVRQDSWMGEYFGFKVRYNDFAFTTNYYIFDSFRFIKYVSKSNDRTQGITGGQLVAKVEISSPFWTHN